MPCAPRPLFRHPDSCDSSVLPPGEVVVAATRRDYERQTTLRRHSALNGRAHRSWGRRRAATVDDGLRAYAATGVKRRGSPRQVRDDVGVRFQESGFRLPRHRRPHDRRVASLSHSTTARRARSGAVTSTAALSHFWLSLFRMAPPTAAAAPGRPRISVPTTSAHPFQIPPSLCLPLSLSQPLHHRQFAALSAPAPSAGPPLCHMPVARQTARHSAVMPVLVLVSGIHVLHAMGLRRPPHFRARHPGVASPASAVNATTCAVRWRKKPPRDERTRRPWGKLLAEGWRPVSLRPGVDASIMAQSCARRRA